MEKFKELANIFSLKKVIFITVVVLVLGIVSVESFVKKDITIIDEDKEIGISILSSNVDDALKKANISLNKYDKLSMDKETKLKDGMKLIIDRAEAVDVKVDGKNLQVLTTFNKVEDILNQHNIEVGEKDKVIPALDERINSDREIEIVRVTEEFVKEEVELPFETITKENDSLDSKIVKKIQEGKEGKKEIEYKVTYENGVEVSREVVNEEIIDEPIDEIVEKGTAKFLVASRGQVLRYEKAIVMSATAYDLSYESTGKRPGDPYYGITRSGTKARPGVVAVDPKVIPLGTKLYIESLDSEWEDYGLASAEDTGGAIKGNKIDLFMENSEDVQKFGRRNVKVYILEEGK